MVTSGRVPLRRAFASTAATQVSFSATSILAAIAISGWRSEAKIDLALMSGVLLMQGLIRVVIGLNLGISGSSEGALYVGLTIAAIGGLAFIGLGYEQWCLALLAAVPFEMVRTVLARSSIPSAHVTVVLADLAWLVPIALLSRVDRLSPGGVLGLAAFVGLVVCLSKPTARGLLRTSAIPSLCWLRRTRPLLVRSSFEASTGLAVPFVVVATLTALSAYDDVNGLRACAQAVSPVGSAVALFVLRWPDLATRTRRFAAHLLVGAPLGLPVLVLLLPGVFSLLSADSPDVLAYSFGWAAFGCVQTSISLSNADRRADLDSAIPPALGIAAVATACGLIALILADDATTAFAIAAVVGAPTFAALAGASFRSSESARTGSVAN